MTDTILVKAVRTFHGEEGFKSPESNPFAVERGRFADLKANGLVEEVKGDKPQAADLAEKAAPTPENKMAPDAENKEAPAAAAASIAGRRTAAR